jgi:signal transduction histidine kinase
MTNLLRGGSLRLRLTLLAALAISTLLMLAGLAFAYLFERHVEKFAVGELNSHFEQLAAGLAFDKGGTLLSSSQLSDPRFEQPQGGMYWQVDMADAKSLRSRSMWDEAFAVPTPPEAEEDDHAHILAGPGGIEVLALEKLLILPTASGEEKKLIVTIAMERDRVSNSLTSFGWSLLIGLTVLYFALLAATALMIYLGLRPLKALKALVQNLRTGRAGRIEGSYPAEVQPLVSELNSLVEAREKQLERARQRAGNLAHGLKTPLTVLTSIANELTHKGETQSAKNIVLSAGQMRDLVDRELARSRMALGESGHHTPLLPSVQRVVETLRRAPNGEKLTWTVEIPAATHIAMDPTDLLELLGNLFDNARKHANSRIQLRHDGRHLTVEDDGPGVPAEKLSTISRRGVKLDALAPGSGLGLSIVSDLAEVYNFEVSFAASELGGLKVTVDLPSLA